MMYFYLFMDSQEGPPNYDLWVLHKIHFANKSVPSDFLCAWNLHIGYYEHSQDPVFDICFFMLFACFSLIGILMYLSLSSYEVKEGEHNKIGEFYSGVRMKTKAKLYVTFLIIRRTLFVLILICLASIPSKSMICILK